MNNELYIIPEVKMTASYIDDVVSFFGGAFQQIIRSTWVNPKGLLDYRDFVVLNVQDMNEEDVLVNKSITFELVGYNPDPSYTMSFDINDQTDIRPTEFSVIKITTDLPALAETFSIRWDQVEEADQWSVTAMDYLTRNSPVQLTCSRQDAYNLVCAPNDPKVDKHILEELELLYGYGLDHDQMLVDVTKVPAGSTLVTADGVTVLRHPNRSWLSDGKVVTVDGPTLPWTKLTPLVITGLSRIEAELFDVLDMVLMMNRKRLTCNIDDPSVIVEAGTKIMTELRGRRMEVNTFATVQVRIYPEVNDRVVELRVTTAPVWGIPDDAFVNIDDIVTGPASVDTMEAMREYLTVHDYDSNISVPEIPLDAYRMDGNVYLTGKPTLLYK